MDQRFVDAEVAVREATRTLEYRLERLNELRELVTAAQSNYATKAEVAGHDARDVARFPSLDKFNALVADVVELKSLNKQNETEHRNRNLTLTAAVIGSIGSSSLVAFVIGHVH